MKPQWQNEVMQAIKRTKTKYISKARLKTLERGVAKKVPAAEFRTFMANEVEKKTVQVGTDPGTSNRDTAILTKPGRKNEKVKARSPRIGKMREAMARWIKRKAEGGREKIPHLTPAMSHQLIHQNSRRGGTAALAEAALITLAAEKTVTVEWHRVTKGGKQAFKEKDVEGTVIQTLKEENWGSEKTIQQTVAAGLRRTFQSTPTPTAIDLGEGWSGAKEGMQRVLRVVGVDKKRQTLMGTVKATPDIITDFACAGTNLVSTVMNAGGIGKNDLIHIHGSPDCTKETTLNRLEASQDRGSGAHAGKKRPADEERAINAIVQGITQTMKTHPHLSYTIENPKDSALKNHRGLANLPGARRVVKYCCYGRNWQKQTSIWTNLGEWWHPKCEQTGTNWLRHCKHCEACRTNTMHEEYIVRRGKEDKRPPAKIPGMNQDATKNRIPLDLAQEWAEAALARWKHLTEPSRKRSREEMDSP